MNAALDRATLFELLTRNPAFYTLLTRLEDDKEILEVDVRNPEYVGMQLKHITLPRDVLIMAVRRDGEMIVPHGNTNIEFGDHVTLVGSLECVEEWKKSLVYQA